MEISTKLSQCLLELNQCSKSELDSTMATVSDLVRGQVHGDASPPSAVVFSVLGLLASLLAEGASASATETRLVLERVGLGAEAATAVQTLLASASGPLLAAATRRAGCAASPFETLVDVAWRLDYLVQSRFQGGPAETRALLALATRGGAASSSSSLVPAPAPAPVAVAAGPAQVWTVQCSRSELADLLGKLREIERDVAVLCEHSC